MTMQVAQSISSEQSAFYEANGYLVVRRFLSPEQVSEVRDTFTSQAEAGFVEGLSDYHYNYSTDDPLARWPRMLQPHRRMDLPVGPLSRKLMLDPRLTAILSDLIDDEPLAAQSMFYFKPPGARGQDFHQDDFYLKTKPGNCMAAWFAIDRADNDNGGLEVVAGSHRLELFCPGESDSSRYFAKERVVIPSGMEAVPVEMEPGDVLFFNGRVIHGSQPNSTSDRFRRTFIGHFVPRSSVELIGWDSPALAPDGTPVEIPGPTGGGPCGKFQPIVPH